MYKGKKAFLVEWHDRVCNICGKTYSYTTDPYNRNQLTGDYIKLSAEYCLDCIHKDKDEASNSSLFGVAENLYYKLLTGEFETEDLFWNSIDRTGKSTGIRNSMRTPERGEYTIYMKFENAADGAVADHINSMSTQAIYWIVFLLEEFSEINLQTLTWEKRMEYKNDVRKRFLNFFESMGFQIYVTTMQNSSLLKEAQNNGTTAAEYVKVMGRGIRQGDGPTKYFTVRETINQIKHACIGDVYGDINSIRDRANNVFKKSKGNISGQTTIKKGLCVELRDQEVKHI